ncbi:ly6/PLAUR domain-containing protein 6B [Erpetoichthys calabaricus]|uniref:LY6/PLAUR domain containing 6B n=1 Tax=Erpetoichthys calabaricus TaxID=27687 RepID=A0A8C4SDL5_ERPCA|nr:ly6/PLAUR domain-containing protein 6B [Erpetoichthys calabaricus]XP_028662366.1 ly6/PLAUR domain-containing protein 6B [Erpetoichthys calabaricus]
MELFPCSCWTVLFQLLEFLFLTNYGISKNINFYNVKPLMNPTPFPNSFKCFTCDHAEDNYNCNRWAEDKWCPRYTEYCMTVHHFTSQGRSKSVTKRCAFKEECQAVGCRHHRDTGHTECISCCEGMVCNVEVPTNHTNAVFYMAQSWRSSGPRISAVSTTIFCIIVLVSLFS